MKTIIRFVLVICILILFISSGLEDQKPQWNGKIEYENGIKVIKNPKEPLYGEITFELEEDLSIGNEEDENYAFYKFVVITVDSEENIFILNGGNSQVQKFDKNGKYLQTIGRRGQGPGEFQDPYGIYLDHEEKLYVTDHRKIHVFNKEGQYIKTIKFYIQFLLFG